MLTVESQADIVMGGTGRDMSIAHSEMLGWTIVKLLGVVATIVS